MVCASCGAANSEEARYCGKCGAALTERAQGDKPAYYRAFSPVGTESRESGYQGMPAYAGFWKRVGATLLDALILALPMTVLTYAVYGADAPRGNNWLDFVVTFLYKTLMDSSTKQGTLGKMIMGIKVTDLNGDRISFGRAAGRYFAAYLSAIILCIGYMMAGWTEKKQALHDIIAGTLVVNKDRA